jgi:hypothetical protein
MVDVEPADLDIVQDAVSTRDNGFKKLSRCIPAGARFSTT